MKLTFLEASMPLTKSFTVKTKSSYPNAFEFTSHTHDVNSLQDFLSHLTHHADQGHCLLKGVIKHELARQSRAGSTESTTSTEWACFDFDGASSMSLITSFLALLGDPDHILQYSASYGVTGQPGTVKLHLFALLSRPTSPLLLKQWLQWQNMEQVLLRAESSLTKTANALSYVLDPTVAQNDKLIYISPPDCDPPSLDTLSASNTPRISLVPGKVRAIDIDAAFMGMPSKEQIRKMAESRINELRVAQGLGARAAFNYKIDKATGTEYLDKPSSAVVTEHKTDRGFVYLNLNGGDSWGYYYPETDNTFVFNFKDEPVYKLQQLDPAFFKASLPAVKAAAAQALKAAKSAAYNAPIALPTPNPSNPQKTPPAPAAKAPAPSAPSPKVFLVFCDNKTSNYYRCIYDVTTSRWDRIDRAANEKQLNDFMLQYGQPESEVVQLWDLLFDPARPALDIPNRIVNMYAEPDLMARARQRIAALPQSVPQSVPPTIHKIIWSVVGSDQQSYDHFINWLRFVVCERRRSQTAWLFNGVNGTGKGLLAHKILRQLIGTTNSAFFEASVLEDKFTDSLETSLLTIIDEVTIGELEDSKKILSNLKSRITEPTITIRKMRTAPYEAPNYNNFVLFSNSKEQIVIEQTDRRYNVGMYQNVKLDISDDEVNNQIPAELEDFAVWLLATPADEIKARSVLLNQARVDMQELSMNSIDETANDLKKGNLEELYEMRIDPKDMQVDGAAHMHAFQYNKLIETIIEHDLDKLTRDQIMLIFQHCAGVNQMSPKKSASFLKHKGIKIIPISINGKTARGQQFTWNCDPQWLADRKAEIAAKKPKPETA
jgi:hypothetical protein